MPVMPRMPGKGKKIAYAILGKPLSANKPAFSRYIRRRLVFEETTRVR